MANYYMGSVEILLPKQNYDVGETVKGELRIDKEILSKAKTITFDVRGYTVKEVIRHKTTRVGKHTRRSSVTREENDYFFTKDLTCFLPKIESTTPEEKKTGFEIFKNPFGIKNPFEHKPATTLNKILNYEFEFTIPPDCKPSSDDEPKVEYSILFDSNNSLLFGSDCLLEFTVISPSKVIN